jgi:hypothetical protein
MAIPMTDKSISTFKGARSRAIRSRRIKSAGVGKSYSMPSANRAERGRERREIEEIEN